MVDGCISLASGEGKQNAEEEQGKTGTLAGVHCTWTDEGSLSAGYSDAASAYHCTASILVGTNNLRGPQDVGVRLTRHQVQFADHGGVKRIDTQIRRAAAVRHCQELLRLVE